MLVLERKDCEANFFIKFFLRRMGGKRSGLDFKRAGARPSEDID